MYKWRTKKIILKVVNKFKISKNFGLELIKTYTAEGFCYIINKIMRNISLGHIGLSYFFSPYDYAFFKFLHNR